MVRPLVAVLLAILVLACSPVSADPSASLRARGGDGTRTLVRRFQGRLNRRVSYPYLLRVPDRRGVAKGRKLPLLLFLHGAGERGTSLEALRRHGPVGPAAHHLPGDCILVAPQCPPDADWDGDALLALVDHVAARNPVDSRRIYLTGMSMGGHAAWNLAVKAPDRFAAAVPICGWAPVYLARRLKDLPVWTFHGAKDPVIPCGRTRSMAEAIRTAGGRIRLTVYPDAGHDSWTAAYDDPALWRWLFGQRRSR